ncbi:putative ribosomal RNA adenine dimethylase family protein [Trypanosoma grayi]|uniref:putative ribosomal RNA adenine dimethylase family protein n=1 Tax=Trypanosoma grayi TaxID=71804 RepID=UPI0004F49DD1|nr:putative ribosomal RNA adenine dimethylase family protein [Trypanosoma grayi]KEG10790.1 putative ribosomal RNA adenine dimethylase family protein [Trypanosoma grayi]
MPKEQRSVPMGVITAEPIHAVSKKLKFATQVTTLGKAAPRKAAKKSEPVGLKTGGSQSGMVFNKGFGQHILKNPLVIAAIVEKAAIKPTDVVLEIGPGTGNLTEKLLQTAKKVIAFEVDPRMVAELNKRFQNTPLAAKLQVVRGNCLEHEFPFFDKCVANVPYAISSALVFKLLKKPTFKCAVLMFQREFALRVCAQPGTEAYCRLSVNSQLLARCSHLMKISKNSFNPPPKVESSVIRLDPKHPAPDVDFEEWDGLVKFIFNRKNKKVSSIFRTKNAVQTLYKKYCSYQKMEGSKDVKSLAEFKEHLESVMQDPLFDKRARMLDQESIMDLLCRFTTNGIHFI